MSKSRGLGSGCGFWISATHICFGRLQPSNCGNVPHPHPALGGTNFKAVNPAKLLKCVHMCTPTPLSGVGVSWYQGLVATRPMELPISGTRNTSYPTVTCDPTTSTAPEDSTACAFVTNHKASFLPSLIHLSHVEVEAIQVYSRGLATTDYCHYQYCPQKPYASSFMRRSEA